MEHIGIDLGGRESQLCIRDAKGHVLHEGRYATADLGRVLAKHGPSRVVMETCAESYAVATAAQKAGHDVRVVPGTLVRTLGVGARGLKTDRRDALVLSEVSSRIDLPTVHLRPVQAIKKTVNQAFLNLFALKHALTPFERSPKRQGNSPFQLLGIRLEGDEHGWLGVLMARARTEGLFPR